MKTTKWFKTGEPIPDNAVYIKTESKIIRWESIHSMLDDTPIYEEQHLYEVHDKIENANSLKIDILNRRSVILNIIEFKIKMHEILLEKKVTQKDIAKAIGFNHMSISRALSPNNTIIPGHRMLSGISEYLNIRYI